MIKDKMVAEELHKKILKSYNPRYDYESACDHNIDWTELSKEEFKDIYERDKKHG